MMIIAGGGDILSTVLARADRTKMTIGLSTEPDDLKGKSASTSAAELYLNTGWCLNVHCTRVGRSPEEKREEPTYYTVWVANEDKCCC